MDGELKFMQNQCCQGGFHSQTELPDCTFRNIDQVYMVILVSFFYFLVKVSLKLVICTCICGYTVEGNVEHLIWRYIQRSEFTTCTTGTSLSVTTLTNSLTTQKRKLVILLSIKHDVRKLCDYHRPPAKRQG